ncbi:PAS domain S-box protein [Haloplanus litoreus]|uniref:hybrid sensor histidine kinase/response regulator n=1 Tax=Haloplanus litoreus TaxID=767515 RepID=UPI003623652E
MNERSAPGTVLVVDDGVESAASTAEALASEGFDAETAETPTEGLDRVGDGEFDCIVSAYAMSPHDGIEVLEAIRETDDVPVVLFTDEGDEAVASAAIAAGVTDYVRKGTGSDPHGRLATRVERAVDEYRTRRASAVRTEELLLYEQIFDRIQEGACLYDEEGRFLIVNDYLAEFYGTTKGALEGRSSRLVDAIRDEGSEEEDPYRKLLDGDRESVEGELELEVSDRGQVVVDYRLAPLETDGPVECVVGVARDVTEWRARQRQSKRAREEYRELINGTNDSVWVIDPDGQFLAVNDAAVDRLGYSRSEFRSMRPHDIDAGLDEEKITHLIETMPEDGRQVFETVHRRKDGETFPVEISSSLVSFRGESAILSVARDITQRKEYEAELREQNELLEQQRDELEVLNQVLRHDIRNDLQLVTAYADILQDFVDEEGQEYLRTVSERANHAVELTRTARDTVEMMNRRETENRPVDLGSTLDDEVANLREMFPEAVITVDSSPQSVTVRAGDMLGSVFRNLLTNAVQHNDEEVPEVTVSTTDTGESVSVRVADNGPGIPDAQKTDIFGKGAKGLDSAGTGLGLHLVRTLVEKYGGSVHVEDNDPTGSVFVVDLPKAD